MAVVSNTITGKTRGSVGNVTFTSWKGLNVMKSKPAHVHNPNTVLQQISKAKMIKTVEFYQNCSACVNLGFSQRAIKKSAYNAFVSKTIKGAGLVFEDEVACILPEHLMVSDGSLAITPITSASGVAATKTFTINWFPDTLEDTLATDLVNVLITTGDGIVIAESIGKSPRGTGVAHVVASAAIPIGVPYYAFLYFNQPKTRKVSNSKVMLVTLA